MKNIIQKNVYLREIILRQKSENEWQLSRNIPNVTQILDFRNSSDVRQFVNLTGGVKSIDTYVSANLYLVLAKFVNKLIIQRQFISVKNFELVIIFLMYKFMTIIITISHLCVCEFHKKWQGIVKFLPSKNFRVFGILTD